MVYYVYKPKTNDSYLYHSAYVNGSRKKITKYLSKGKLTKPEISMAIKENERYFKEQQLLVRFEERIRQYNLQALSLKDLSYLEYMRWSYNIFLKEFLPSELENFENNHYTKYVFNSVNIEGNTLTYEQTNLVLNENLAPNGKTLREVNEVSNYKKLLSFMSAYKGDITRSLILKINKILLNNIKDDVAGTFRRPGVDVFIRVAKDFTPVPGIMVEKEMLNLIKWYNKHRKNIHPFELACIFHQKFEEIHPFIDGNGRVGRELFRFILKKNKFPPVFFKTHKSKEYWDALKEGNTQNYKPLMLLGLESLNDEFSSIFGQGDKTEEIVKRYREIFHITDRQAKLKDYNL